LTVYGQYFVTTVYALVAIPAAISGIALATLGVARRD
jgi:hypothetical protein